MISKCQITLNSIKTEYEPRDLELFVDGYESLEQLKEETVSLTSPLGPINPMLTLIV